MCYDVFPFKIVWSHALLFVQTASCVISLKSYFLPLQPKPLMQIPISVVELPIPKEPPPEFEYLADPPSISALDLYVQTAFAMFFL